MPDDFQPGDALELAYAVRVRAINVGGTVDDIERAAPEGTRGRSLGPLRTPVGPADRLDGSTQVLGSAMDGAEMRIELIVPLRDLTPGPPAVGGRSGAADPHIEVTVPAPPTGEGQVVLEVDDAGVARWHLADAPAETTQAVRAMATETYRVPVRQIDVRSDRNATNRGLLGFGLRKILHIIRFPIQAAAELAGDVAVGWWEKKYRPYGLDIVDPTTAGLPLTGDGVSADHLATLAGNGPFLLMVHGTFSRGRAGFRGIIDDTDLFPDLVRRYDGRVLMFDHPTMHVDPIGNVDWLLGRLPVVPMTFDVVSHSRGGLVARQLHAAGGPTRNVRALVHVATPNHGTVLASPDKLGKLLDVFTNLLSLFPDSPAGVAIEGVLEVVKQVATGVLGGLDGLAAMDPKNPWLTELDTRANDIAASHGVTTDYEPASGAALPARALDVLVDGIFGVGNDLVVPTEGVYSAGAYTVPDPLIVPTAAAVTHTGYFDVADVRAALSGWLTGRPVN